MTRRLPVVPTLVVAIAVAAMIALGLWQLLDRRPKKLAQIAQIAANPGRPMIALPSLPDDSLLFRRATGFCLDPGKTTVAGAGAAGFRVIVECRTGAEGPGMLVQLGTTRDPRPRIDWRGGLVRGFLAHAPDNRPLIATVFDHRPVRMMLIGDAPPAGLAANLPPDLSEVSNPHLGYAMQWFAFAAAAIAIYGFALRQRWRVPPRGDAAGASSTHD